MITNLNVGGGILLLSIVCIKIYIYIYIFFPLLKSIIIYLLTLFNYNSLYISLKALRGFLAVYVTIFT